MHRNRKFDRTLSPILPTNIIKKNYLSLAKENTCRVDIIRVRLLLLNIVFRRTFKATRCSFLYN